MKINKNRIGLNISLLLLFGFILLYAFQDFQTSANAGVKDVGRSEVHLLLVVILAFLGAYYIRSVTRGKLVKSHITTVLWLLTGWIIVVNLIQGVNDWIVAVQLGLSILWILVYHFFSNYIRRFPNAWLNIQICIGSVFVFYVFSALYAAYTMQLMYSRIAVVNLVYSVLVFLPWISLMSIKWMRNLGHVLVFFIIMISMKRGAIIAYPLMLITWLFLRSIHERNIGRTAIRIVLMVVLFYGSLIAVDQVTGGFLSNRFSAESLAAGSGRTQFYGTVIQEISQRSAEDLILGLGSGSSIQLLGTGVHNEWLEFAFSFGFVGVILYLLLFHALAKRTIKLIRESSPYAASYAMESVYMLVVGMVGGIYFVHSTLYAMAFFGIVEGLTINDQKSQQLKQHSESKCHNREGEFDDDYRYDNFS